MAEHEAHSPPVAFSPAEARQAKRLGLVLVITIVFAGLELTGAVLAKSDVLIADGAHLLLDVVALALSLGAMRLAIRPPSERFTFGLRRIEPMAALLNGVLVVIVASLILREAFVDLEGTSVPKPTLMLIVAGAALVVHGIGAWLIHDAIGQAGHDHAVHAHAGHAHAGHAHAGHAHAGHAHGHALNLRSVWLHLMGDLLGALTALVAALIIRYGGSPHFDAGGSIVVALLLLAGAGKLLKDAVFVLLDAAPLHLPSRAVKDVVLSVPGVLEVRQLRVWSLGAGHDAVLVSVLARESGQRDESGERGEALAAEVRERLHHELGIELAVVETTSK